MIVSLGYGKQVEVSVEQYLTMSDNELLFLTGYSNDFEISDPFQGSVLDDGEVKSSEDFDEDIEDPLLEELMKPNPNERLSSADFLNADDY